MKGAVLAGAVVLLLSGSALAQAAGGDPAAGKDVYDVRCTFCHGDGGVGGQGPKLIGVVGRKAASVPDFAYTPALKGSGLTWTLANLDKFLTNPPAMVPGTSMPMSVPDEERHDLIAYLATLH